MEYQNSGKGNWICVCIPAAPPIDCFSRTKSLRKLLAPVLHEHHLQFTSLTSKTRFVPKPLLDFLQPLDKHAGKTIWYEEIPAGLYNGNDCGAMRKQQSHFKNSCNLLLISEGQGFCKSQTRAPEARGSHRELLTAWKASTHLLMENMFTSMNQVFERPTYTYKITNMLCV